MPKERKVVKMKLVIEEIYESIQQAGNCNNVEACTISNRIKHQTIVNNEMFFHYDPVEEFETWVSHPILPIDVSDLGRIKYKNGRIANLTGKRYLKITVDGECFNVHRLVAETFLENVEDKPFVHHIDHDKNNNRLDNLMWVTHMENVQFYQEFKNNK
jgi:hypothetical protein